MVGWSISRNTSPSYLGLLLHILIIYVITLISSVISYIIVITSSFPGPVNSISISNYRWNCCLFCCLYYLHTLRRTNTGNRETPSQSKIQNKERKALSRIGEGAQAGTLWPVINSRLLFKSIHPACRLLWKGYRGYCYRLSLKDT